MQKILLTGAGGSATLGFVKSLRASPGDYHIIGCDVNKYYLERSEADEKYLIPKISDPYYEDVLMDIIRRTSPDFIYSQVDVEIIRLSEMREKFDRAGVKYFWPRHEIIEICNSKYKSFEYWKKSGLTVPETYFINNEKDLEKAFTVLSAPLWIREERGAFGKGSLPAQSIEEAKIWINIRSGWGKFTAAEMLDPASMVTWQSIWHKGELIVAQTRKRIYWEFSNRSASGVTGLTGAGITISDKTVDGIAEKAILAIDRAPHGIYSVDMTYNRKGVPNPTEINIARFFTTHLFFTEAGLNMPHIFMKIGLDGEIPKIAKKINPLPPNLVWIRGLDFLPVLTDVKKLEKHEALLKKRISSLTTKDKVHSR